MASTAIHGQMSRNLPQSALGLIAAPFRAVWRFLIHLAECSHMGQQVERLNSLSDEELAARGLTREGEIRRIFNTFTHS